MRILITGGASALGAALARALTPAHDIQLLDMGEPSERERALQAAPSSEAIIHLVSGLAPETAPLDRFDIATRGSYDLITAAPPAARFILVSSLRMFERYPVDWWVTEHWAPRPTTAITDLTPYLAELVVREAARVLPLRATALRLGEVVGSEVVGATESQQRPADPRWLHIEDAVQAIVRALALPSVPGEPPRGWQVFHIPGGGGHARFPLELAGRPPLEYTPEHDVTGAALPARSDAAQAIPPRAAAPPRARQRVVIFGAGGPLGVATAVQLAPDHILRLSDRRELAAIAAAGQPQSPGAPLPQPFGPPHEECVVDVTDLGQVVAAARGMDAIVNSTVVRDHSVESFRVNTLGAYNVMRAAVACGIRRVVHTGPRQLLASPVGFRDDFDLMDDVPLRPGTHLYFMSKFLGQEICRIFAEEHDLEVPVLLFSRFLSGSGPIPGPTGDYQMLISWEDAGRAMRQAVDVAALPRPFEILQITADVPNGRFRNEKARRLLGWTPQDRLEERWRRRPS